MKKFRETSTWCFFIDADEFLYQRDDDNVTTFLEKYMNYNLLYIPWLCFGTSHHIEQPSGLVIENFTFHSSTYHIQGKSIVRLDSIEKIHDVHNIVGGDYNENSGPFNYKQFIYHLPVHINHYVKNSVKVFLKRKVNRKEIGFRCGERHNPKDIFNSLFLDNEAKETNNLSRFIPKLKTILNINSLGGNMNFGNPKKCELGIVLNDKIKVFGDEDINFEYLEELIQNKNLTFPSWNQLLPEDFDVSQYKSNYPNLLNMSNSDAKIHYYLHGKKENLQYVSWKDKLPKDFDPNSYKLINLDLSDLSDEDVSKHYVFYGRDEGRPYKDKNVNS